MRSNKIYLHSILTFKAKRSIAVWTFFTLLTQTSFFSGFGRSTKTDCGILTTHVVHESIGRCGWLRFQTRLTWFALKLKLIGEG